MMGVKVWVEGGYGGRGRRGSGSRGAVVNTAIEVKAAAENEVVYLEDLNLSYYVTVTELVRLVHLSKLYTKLIKITKY